MSPLEHKFSQGSSSLSSSQASSNKDEDSANEPAVITLDENNFDSPDVKAMKATR